MKNDVKDFNAFKKLKCTKIMPELSRKKMEIAGKLNITMCT
jgi:hypothetical protein